MKKFRQIHGHTVLINERSDKNGNIKLKNSQTGIMEKCHRNDCIVKKINGKNVIYNKNKHEVYRVTF